MKYNSVSDETSASLQRFADLQNVRLCSSLSLRLPASTSVSCSFFARLNALRCSGCHADVLKPSAGHLIATFFSATGVFVTARLTCTSVSEVSASSTIDSQRYAVWVDSVNQKSERSHGGDVPVSAGGFECTRGRSAGRLGFGSAGRLGSADCRPSAKTVASLRFLLPRLCRDLRLRPKRLLVIIARVFRCGPRARIWHSVDQRDQVCQGTRQSHARCCRLRLVHEGHERVHLISKTIWRSTLHQHAAQTSGVLQVSSSEHATLPMIFHVSSARCTLLHASAGRWKQHQLRGSTRCMTYTG